MGRTGWAVLLVGIVPVGAAAAQETAAPPVIDSIVVVTRNIFDSTEARSSFFFRLANAIHFTTRPSVVRHELLFRTGERYDSALVAETLRNLRQRGLFRDVAIDTVWVGDRVNVRVRTADGWTTELVLNARSTGGEFSWAAGVQERNFLGAGARVGVSYRDEPERTALTVLAALDRYRGTRFGVSVVYDDLSDGEVGAWQLGWPFRALNDRRALELRGRAGRERVLQFQEGDSLQTFRRRMVLQRGEVAFAPRARPDGYLRVGLAAQVKREEYVPWALRDLAISDTVTVAVGAFAELRDARFLVVTHYNGFARDEDLDLSTRVRLGVWMAPAAFGYRETGIGPNAMLQIGGALGAQFFKLEARANGLFTSSGLDSGQVWGGLTVASRALRRHATVIHLEAGARRGTPPGEEFDLGHGRGPRAFGSHAFTGERMVWGSLEHRAFVIDEVLGLLGVGFAGFVDYGGAWFTDQPVRLGGDIGLGLRIGATRATGQNVGRLDVAYRFGEGFDGKRWVVSFGRGFAF